MRNLLRLHYENIPFLNAANSSGGLLCLAESQEVIVFCFWKSTFSAESAWRKVGRNWQSTAPSLPLPAAGFLLCRPMPDVAPGLLAARSPPTDAAEASSESTRLRGLALANAKSSVYHDARHGCEAMPGVALLRRAKKHPPQPWSGKIEP